ncbi:hypothetical protein ABIC10_009627, partial [Bradyrhizobium sp. S3.2.12]
GRQTFPGHVIDDIQDPEATAAGELVVDKIQRLTLPPSFIQL